MLLHSFILLFFIAIGDGKQFPKPESEIRFGWGLAYNYIGQLQHNLDKYDMVVGLEIPDFRSVVYYKPFSTDPYYCRQWNNELNKILYDACSKVWPAYLATITKFDQAKDKINHIMEKEIPAVIPNFELKQMESDSITTTAYPIRRTKRFIIDLISLGIQGFTAFNTNRKLSQLKKGMRQLFEKENHLENKVIELEKDMISLARVAIEGLDHLQDESIRQGRHVRNLTKKVKEIELRLGHIDYHVASNTNAIKFLSSLFGMLLSDLNRYLMLYDTILFELDHFLDALENLSNNQLLHSVIPPNELHNLIQHVKEVVSEKYSTYELVVSEVHDLQLAFYNFCVSGQHSDNSYFFLH